ncbi:MAG: acetylxylan esterase [Thermoguttaceae bacterium]|nr:acetylxylan esterase [Thermoguttaceae bacterium]MBQ3333124.1 acetylxylan esterase [Thermoguttaceae bacterium]MBQ6618779.1 acetylxylan esterase [Thermoguttaceae bacterium]
MKRAFFPPAALLALLLPAAFAVLAWEANYDESRVGTFDLPDPLLCADGTPITAPEEWTQKRRGELLELFEREMYGVMPPKQCARLKGELLSEKSVFGGKAVQRQVVLYLNAPEETPKMNLLIFLPANAQEPAPAILAPNFEGNPTVSDDPDIIAPNVPDATRIEKGKPIERGAEKSCWALEKIIDRGWALVTVFYEEIDPDYDDHRQNGVHPLLRAWEDKNNIPWESRAATITAWAWGLSRALDYLQTLSEIDPDKVAVMGHSRLGKTALWTAACDERFAAAISNDSGCGGAALTRRNFGETIEVMDTALWWWFCPKYSLYAHNPNLLPFDQHELIALIAPRPVYIASAAEDLWADPKGEFLSALGADPVYRLLGTDGIAAFAEQPPLDTPVGGTIHYHIRGGEHDVTDFDWDQYLDFLDKYVRGK